MMKMKMKMKALVAVTALAIGSQAQAAIYDDLLNIGGAAGNGDGELFLSVVDRGAVVPRSYIRDLGITVNEFRANPNAALNFAADANLTDILTNKTGTIFWNIAGASNVNDPAAVVGKTYLDFGYLSTSNTALTSSNVPGGIAGIAGALGKLGLYVGNANAELGVVGSPATTDYAADVSQIVTNTSSIAYYDQGAWGDTWNTSHSTEAGLGSSLGFWFVGLDIIASDIGEASYGQKLNGTWTLAANGNLGYSVAAVPAIPVPAAVWLLGSALVGLVGVARRKSESVKA